MTGRWMKVSRPILPPKLVAMATSLEWLGKKVRSIIYSQILTIWWKFKSVQYILRLMGENLTTKLNLTKFTHNVEKSLLLNPLKLKLLYSSPFWNAMRQMKLSRPVLPILPLKLVAIATTLHKSEKGRVIYLWPNTYHLVKTWWKSVQ